MSRSRRGEGRGEGTFGVERDAWYVKRLQSRHRPLAGAGDNGENGDCLAANPVLIPAVVQPQLLFRHRRLQVRKTLLTCPTSAIDNISGGVIIHPGKAKEMFCSVLFCSAWRPLVRSADCCRNSNTANKSGEVIGG